MFNTLKNFFVLLCLVAILIMPYFVFAQSPTQMLKDTQPTSGYAAADSTSMSKLIGRGINAFLSLLGMIFIVLILYAGFNWMTASGEENKVSRAKDTIKRAVIGLVITLSAYVIWNFIYYAFIFPS